MLTILYLRNLYLAASGLHAFGVTGLERLDTRGKFAFIATKGKPELTKVKMMQWNYNQPLYLTGYGKTHDKCALYLLLVMYAYLLFM